MLTPIHTLIGRSLLLTTERKNALLALLSQMNSNQTAMLRRLLESEEAAVQDLAQKIIHTRLLEPDGKAALAEFDKLLQSSVATIRKDAEHADQIGDNEHLEHFFDTQP